MRTPAPAASQGAAEGAHQVDQAHGFPDPSGMMPCSDMHWQRGAGQGERIVDADGSTALGIDDDGVGGWWLRRLRRAVCGLSSGVAEHLWPGRPSRVPPSGRAKRDAREAVAGEDSSSKLSTGSQMPMRKPESRKGATKISTVTTTTRGECFLVVDAPEEKPDSRAGKPPSSRAGPPAASPYFGTGQWEAIVAIRRARTRHPHPHSFEAKRESCHPLASTSHPLPAIATRLVSGSETGAVDGNSPPSTVQACRPSVEQRVSLFAVIRPFHLQADDDPDTRPMTRE